LRKHFHVISHPLCDPAERQSGLRLDDWLPTEFTRIRDVARGTTTEACFIDAEAGALRIFDAIRERFAIGQDGSDLDRVLHLRFAAPKAVWTTYGQLPRRSRMELFWRSAVIYAAQPEVCGACALKGRCTARSRRFVTRHLHEAALQGMDQRATPEVM